jgi:hypothetical protein
MLDQLKLLIRAGNPVVAIESRDEGRAAKLVRDAAEGMHVPLFEWSATTGLKRILPSPSETGVKPGKPNAALEYVLDHKDADGREVYLFRDLGPFAADPLVARMLRDVFAREKVTLVLVEADPLPPHVRRLAVTLQLPLPGPEELERVVRDTYRTIRDAAYEEISSTLTTADLEQIVHTLRGLTAAEAARVIAGAIFDDYWLSPEDLPRIVEAKRNLLQGTGCLESVGVNFTVGEVGGLAALKKWLAVRRGGMTADARRFGLDPPRGILLLGVQGCGKSLCAKAVAADWRMPLLRMDPGCSTRSTSGRARTGCGRPWPWPRRWPRWCSGSTRSRRRSPRPRPSRPTAGCRSGCSARCCRGCRTSTARSTSWRRPTTSTPCRRS